LNVLTINEENRLRQKVQQLTAQRQDDIEPLKKQMQTMFSVFSDIFEKPPEEIQKAEMVQLFLRRMRELDKAKQQ
jgi:hypothetical protein